MDLNHAIADVEQAFRLLEFAIRTMNYFELSRVDINLFGQDTAILLQEQDVLFNDRYFVSTKNAIITSRISVGVAFGATAIVLDNLFESTGKSRDPSSYEEFHLVWSLVYAVRNAFAHGISKPIWRVNRKYQIIIELSLNNSIVSVNLAELDGKLFEYSQIGGFHNWLHIKKHSLHLVNT